MIFVKYPVCFESQALQFDFLHRMRPFNNYNSTDITPRPQKRIDTTDNSVISDADGIFVAIAFRPLPCVTDYITRRILLTGLEIDSVTAVKIKSNFESLQS